MKKKYSVKYRNVILKFDFNPRRGVCICCGKSGKTNLHHTKYAYTVDQVRKNPKLAFHNTLELCYHPCHSLANAWRKIDDDKCMSSRLRHLINKSVNGYKRKRDVWNEKIL